MLDLTKPVQTRDGRKARIICTDANHTMYPVVGLITTEGIESPYSFALNGQYDTREELSIDIINIPQRHKHADVIVAWANGAEIEIDVGVGRWVPVEYPRWEEGHYYRVKPA